MKREGPVLEALTRRLAETPADFMAEPRLRGRGGVEVGAVVGDLCRRLGGAAAEEDLLGFAGADAQKDRNRLAVALVLCWLLADPLFEQEPPPQGDVLGLLGDGARELAALTPAPKFVTDPDHREELARFALARLGLRPAGETLAQAQDRLSSLSAGERARVLAASRAAEKRARAIREALAKKKAEESADKWTRE